METEKVTKEPIDILTEVKKTSENQKVRVKGIVFKENEFYKLYGKEDKMNVQIESKNLNDSLLGCYIEVEGTIKNRIWFNGIYPSIIVEKYKILEKPKNLDPELYNLSQKQFQTNKYNQKQNNLILYIVAIIIVIFALMTFFSH